MTANSRDLSYAFALIYEHADGELIIYRNRVCVIDQEFVTANSDENLNGRWAAHDIDSDGGHIASLEVDSEDLEHDDFTQQWKVRAGGSVLVEECAQGSRAILAYSL